MKVLMFGWEFPPHISGGLGTASYGLTKALSELDDMEIIFVVPRLFGDEDQGVAKLISASEIPLTFYQKKYGFKLAPHSINLITEKIKDLKQSEEVSFEKLKENITYLAVNSPLIPYADLQTFEIYLKSVLPDSQDITITKDGKILISENGVLKTLKIEDFEKQNLQYIGKIQFSGGYGKNLLVEVKNYALVAKKIAQLYDFDVIHAHDWLTYLAGIEAKHISGKPLVIHVHATEFDRSGENVNTVVYGIEKYGMQQADKIITVSNWTRNIVINKYGIPADKVVTVYNAVEPPKRVRKYKKNVPEKIVTFLGRITFQKGPEYFVEAARLVLSKTRDVRFVMAGSGDMFYRMIRYASRLRIMDRFHFTNFLRGEEVTRMFDISDVYVMPSVSEPFGISPLEAMSSNVPVVISKQSGVSEILKHAIKIDFWDTYAMADAIYGLIKYNGLSALFKKYAKKEIQNFKWITSAKKVKQIYSSVVNN